MLGLGFAVQVALGAVFIDGVIFFLLSLPLLGVDCASYSAKH